MTEQALPSVFSTQFVSHAQNCEDVMLWRALRHVASGFYIDIGAQSPETDSITKAFSLRGWRGINIEPHPVYLEQLCRLRPDDINLGIAISDRAGRVTMSMVDGTGLSTADEAFALQHAASGYAIRAHEVDVRTLAQLWDEYVPHAQDVHFLKIDVEGLEEAVLVGNDWLRNRPWIVLVEAMLPNEQVESHEAWEPVLTKANYRFVYADGLNRFYVSQEQMQLAHAFKYPPNVFDGYVGIAQSNAEAQWHRVEAQATSLGVGLNEANVRIAATETALNEAVARASAEREALFAQLVARDRVVAEITKRAELAERERAALVQSPWWRLTSPARRLAGAMPPAVRRHGRRLLKLTWWAVTPWRIPGRLEALRSRQAAPEHEARAVAMPELNLYPLQEPGSPVEPPLDRPAERVANRAEAARWCIDLLRFHPDIRALFPRALSQPDQSGFSAWVNAEGAIRFGLTESERLLILETLRIDPSARVRAYLRSRPDVLARFPDGLESAGQGRLYRWFVDFGCAEGSIPRDEVLWLLMSEREGASLPVNGRDEPRALCSS